MLKRIKICFPLIALLLWQACAHSEPGPNTMPPTTDELISALQLEAHVEGGYFRRTFQADHRPKINTTEGDRFTLTSIFYLLTAQSPIGHWHENKSDIIHYFHLGGPIDYYLIQPNGELEKVTMGPNPLLGHKLQLTVKGGTWKASHLVGEDYGLISEAVAPGFDYQDMTLGKREKLLQQFPQHKVEIIQFTDE